MMSWEEVIKATRDRKGKLNRRTGEFNTKPSKQTRIAGGNPMEDLSPRDSAKGEETLSQYGEESSREEMDELAEMTRSDLMDLVMERIGEMSKKELLDILTKTQGNLKEAL